MTAEMTAGYKALRQGAAVLDLSARGKLRVTGEDRARLLHAMSTNHIQQLKPGEGCYAFFLNAQGRILGDANVLCFEDHFLLDTEPETRTKLFEHLDRYIIADDAAVEDYTDRMATIALEGPQAEPVLAKLGAPHPEGEYASLAWGDQVIARINSTGSSGFFIFTAADDKATLIAELISAGAAPATAEDARTVRLEHGRPRYGEEINERFLVQETGQMHAIHFTKGCYLGQEIVERVRSRAQIHRVLRKLEIDTYQPPPAGTKLKVGDADGAEIVGAAYSPALGKTVALAYVRVPHSEPGTELTLGDGKARVAG